MYALTPRWDKCDMQTAGSWATQQVRVEGAVVVQSGCWVAKVCARVLVSVVAASGKRRRQTHGTSGVHPVSSCHTTDHRTHERVGRA